ncbi:hypothetical protein [Falsiroseomonas oryziterrae]|uniref:hypothetical protein n=1 Tax=Falsiroseomonas oryziterrae TaxID=2911368 RepID=UPI001F4073A1|nr:hypothetical protein [Roseomonas sp. NPKOSM-4]
MRCAAIWAVCVLLSLLSGGRVPLAAEHPAQLVQLPEPVGLGRLLTPPEGPQAALVIVLPDALGEDGRSEAYVDSLLARGIATLVLGLGEDLEARPSSVDPAASPQAAAVALAWAEEAGFDAAATGLLGFGLGGRAILAADRGVPGVALYPGCSRLLLPTRAPALVVQGEEQAQDCAALVGHPGVTLRELRGAGHAWDAPGAIWPSPGPVLPDPDGGAPLRARADLDVTLAAAEAVADWFAAVLVTAQQSAAR